MWVIWQTTYLSKRTSRNKQKRHQHLGRTHSDIKHHVKHIILHLKRAH